MERLNPVSIAGWLALGLAVEATLGPTTVLLRGISMPDWYYVDSGLNVVIWLTIGIALLRRMSWGLVLALVWAGAGVLALFVFVRLAGHPVTTLVTWLKVGLFLAMIVLLLIPRARRDFQAMAGRPAGITVLAVLSFLGPALLKPMIVQSLDAVFSGRGWGLIASPLVSAAAILVPVATGIGLWGLRPWGRWLAIGTHALAIAALLGSVATSGASVEETAGLAVSALILWYLLRPGVRRAFAS